MNYVAEFSPEALEDLDGARLSLEILEEFERRIELLESSPVVLSRPSWFPYPQCLIYEFLVQAGSRRWRFRILFKYGADEHTIFVLRVDIAKSAIG